MDDLGLPPAPVKRRRRQTAEFKDMVVKATFEPGNSVAGIAHRYNLNDNLVHKWRRQPRMTAGAVSDDFIKLPMPPAPPTVAADTDMPETIRVEVPGVDGPANCGLVR